jgi:hypothetical protein
MPGDLRVETVVVDPGGGVRERRSRSADGERVR